MISYEKAKKVKELLKQGKTYSQIQKEVGIARASISKIKKMSDKDLEELKKREQEKIEKEGKSAEERIREKAEKATWKQLIDSLTQEAVRNVKFTLLVGQTFKEYQEWLKEQEMLKKIEELNEEKLKHLAFKVLLSKYLTKEISKEDFLARALVMEYL
jgi:hypothetical protein